MSIFRLFLFPKRIKLIRQVAERHTDDGDDDVGNGRPPLEDLDEEFQAEIVDEDITNGDEKVPDNLCPTTQSGTRKTDVSRHPEACEEGDGELEHEGCNVRCKGDKTEVKHLSVKHIVVENIIQHPFQSQIHAATSRIAEQLKVHKFAERRVKKVDDLGQGTFYPGFYVFED